jgi:glycosyltransferase involved in cell wall biosynthesis
VAVSVIIPNYNHAAYLAQRIESILNQSYRDFELIILDDGSTDNSRDIINQYKTDNPVIKTIYNDSNSGNPFSQWNKGVVQGKEEFVWIAESDDSAEPDFLHKAVDTLEKHPEAGMVFADSRIINEIKGVEYLASQRNKLFTNDKLEKIFNNTTLNKNLLSFFDNPIVNVSSVLFRRSKYLEAGGAEASMRYCGDWMLYLKLFLTSGIRYIPEPLSIFRLHTGSGYHSHFRSNTMLKERFRIYSLIMQESNFTPKLALGYVIGVFKSLILRLITCLRIDSVLRIERPRQPRIAKNL